MKKDNFKFLNWILGTLIMVSLGFDFSFADNDIDKPTKNINEHKWVDIIFNYESKISYKDKKQIVEQLTDFGKKDEEGDGYQIDDNHMFYISKVLNTKDEIQYKFFEEDINNDGVVEIFVIKNCPTYLCGTTATVVIAFYKINNKYKRVFSDAAADYAIVKSNAIYPDIVYMGRGFECVYLSWNKQKLKYKFDKVLKNECKNFHWKRYK